ncbi:tRNA (adenosine(37)-N6)-threonylcarbamoyltransferase complex ATPase subunit type 1 TsaE [Niabella yanshanensis]|uniref:tRNA threonylcarbamoyladenosine biosynthesis protein TsaE n=1 Tax=Niabella yanshanensis TaxID=577386 RepID=A0ABZ0W250_9BACT|nr:tRNA (adenosine(37)-N6)-threonylcarbamoyltransferase complex ATPase subunit type 1 TsaE [Niabella yanshanensis]WQD37281.1 tRNA (adenosine(37)-N6)-threonylcarbamoyltransferase complex ATPase subunit type 1 TsaE [Niabella yanshanensis]
MPTIRKYTLPEIDQTAQWLLDELKNRKVIALHGTMGAGKTTLISAVCSLLKVEDVVSSPTFSVINEYRYNENGITKRLYHIDLYRLKDEEEAIRTGVEDCLYSGDYCFVEWPERAEALFPDDTTTLYLRVEGDTERSLEIA